MKTTLQKYLDNDISMEEFDRMVSVMELASDDELSELISDDFHKFINETEEKKRPVSRFAAVMSVAAAVLLLLCVGLSIRLAIVNRSVEETSVTADTIIRSDGGRSLMTLPDGTKVILNSGSVIAYPANFNKEYRCVSLEGEAFFDVAENKARAFTVTVPGMEISVHGTKFNVYAYPEMAYSEMALVEGSVSAKAGDKEYNVSPGQKVCVSRNTGRMNLFATDNILETCWLKDKIVFMHEPLHKVVDVLQRYFGVEIVCSEEIDLSDIYTGTFRDKNIYNILDVLKMHYGFEYETSGRKIKITHK